MRLTCQSHDSHMFHGLISMLYLTSFMHEVDEYITLFLDHFKRSINLIADGNSPTLKKVANAAWQSSVLR